MSRRTSLIALVLPLCALSFACTGSDPSLDNIDYDDATCAPQAQQAFNDCAATCDANFANDDSCESGVATDFAGKVDAIDSDLQALQVRPAFVDQTLSCLAGVDAMPDCSGVGDQLSATLDGLGGQYGFDPGWVASVVGTIGSGTCDFGRTVARGGCIIQHAGEAASHYADLGGDLAGRIGSLGWDLASMLAGQAGCFAGNVANDVQRAACVGADLGPASVGCYGTKYSAYWSCRGTCPAQEGSSCVPPGVPGWVDCGYWGGDLDGACECIGDAIRAPVCRTFAWDTTWDKSNGAPCELSVDGAQVRARRYFIVDHDQNGGPSGGSIQCVAVDDFDMPCTMPGPQQGCPAGADL